MSSVLVFTPRSELYLVSYQVSLVGGNQHRIEPIGEHRWWYVEVFCETFASVTHLCACMSSWVVMQNVVLTCGSWLKVWKTLLYSDGSYCLEWSSLTLKLKRESLCPLPSSLAGSSPFPFISGAVLSEKCDANPLQPFSFPAPSPTSSPVRCELV